MRRLLLSVLFAASILLSWNVSDALATADQIPCYCRYNDPSKLDSTEKLYCLGEVAFVNLVDNSISQSSEIAACASVCASNGGEYIGPSTLDPSGYLNTSGGDMVKDEKDHCIVSKYENNHLPGQSMEITGWTASYGDCKEPVNSIRGFWPEACSFCFCKFRAVAGLNGACVGKTTMVHATGAPANCQALCGSLQLDFDSAAADYGDRCDYRASNGCSTPLNAKGTGCDATLTNAATLKKIVNSRGSVVTLPLPLSNISIPGLIGRVLNALLGIVGALSLLMFVWGGFRWMTAAGNTDQVAKAKKTIVWAALGLVAIFSSYAVLSFVINAIR